MADSGASDSSGSDVAEPPPTSSPTADRPASTDNPYRDYTWIQLHDSLMEKEYQLECMSDSVQRLTAFEEESKRKDEVVAGLRKELAAYKKNSRHKDFSYVSLEEHLASCESHLKEKSREADYFHQELAKVKGQLQAETQQKLSFQQQLNNKTTTLASQAVEIKCLQRQKKEAEEQAEALRHTCKERQTKISSLQESVKRLRASCQETQKRLEASQTQQKTVEEKEQRASLEVEKLKGHSTAIAQFQARQEILEEELDKTRKKEGTLSVELNSLCQQVLWLTLGESHSSETASPAAAIAAVSSLMEQHTQSQRQVESLAGQLEEEQEHLAALSSNLEELTNFLNTFKGSSEGDDEAKCSHLQSLISSVQRVNCNESLTHLTDALVESMALVHSSLTQLTSRWKQLTEQLAEGCAGVEECKGKEDVSQQLSSLIVSRQSLLAQCQELEERLAGKEAEQSAALSGAATAFRHESQQRVEEVMQRVRHEEKERYEQELQAVREQLEGEKQAAVMEEKRQAQAVRGELENTKQLLVEKETQLAEKKDLESELNTLQGQMRSLEQSTSEALCVAEQQRATLSKEMHSEVESYKEQSHQYALTIAALEEKLLALVQKHQLLQKENEKLKELSRATGEQAQLEKMEQLVNVLRHQLALSCRECEQQQARLQELQQELQQRTDMEGQLKTQHMTELEDLKKTLSSQEGMIASQREELVWVQKQLQEKSSQLLEQQEEHKRMQEKMAAELKMQVETVKRESEERAGELCQAGQRCLGEQHAQLISKQKEGISELRKRLQEAEAGKPPVPSHEATLRELDRVRQELMEERARRRLEESLVAERSTQTTDSVIDALQYSEESYLDLVGKVCESASMKRPVEKRIPVSAGRGEQQGILEDRKRFAKKIAEWIKRTLPPFEDAPESDDGSSEPDPMDTIARLQQALEMTTEKLEQQQRINLALIKKKEFHEQQARARRPHHNCLNTE